MASNQLWEVYEADVNNLFGTDASTSLGSGVWRMVWNFIGSYICLSKQISHQPMSRKLPPVCQGLDDLDLTRKGVRTIRAGLIHEERETTVKFRWHFHCMSWGRLDLVLSGTLEDCRIPQDIYFPAPYFTLLYVIQTYIYVTISWDMPKGLKVGLSEHCPNWSLLSFFG